MRCNCVEWIISDSSESWAKSRQIRLKRLCSLLPLLSNIPELIAGWIRVAQVRNQALIQQWRQTYYLGAGEVSTVLLAKELSARFALIDDRRARALAVKEDWRLAARSQPSKPAIGRNTLVTFVRFIGSYLPLAFG